MLPLFYQSSVRFTALSRALTISQHCICAPLDQIPYPQVRRPFETEVTDGSGRADVTSGTCQKVQIVVYKLICIFYSHYQIVTVFMPYPPTSDPSALLFGAASRAEPDEVRYLLEHTNANINHRGVAKHTPLMMAASSSIPRHGLETTLVILELGSAKGLEIDAAKGPGEPTALLLCAMSGDVATAEALIKAGADIRYRTREDSTFLHYAAHNRSPEMMQLGLSHGLPVNHPNIIGTTALMSASQYSSLKTIELLLQEGADPHARDKTPQKASALEYARSRILATDQAIVDGNPFIQRIKQAQLSRAGNPLHDPAGRPDSTVSISGNATPVKDPRTLI